MISYILLSTFVTWIFYYVIMGLKRRKKEITGLWRIPAYFIVIIGMVIDVIYNVTAGTVIFIDLPKELLFTSRLQRYKNEMGGWRYIVATWFCQKLLNPYDPSGKHC